MSQMTTEGLGKQSASTALANLELESVENDSLKGPFGVLVLSEASTDSKQDELQLDQIESDQLEWDLLWPGIARDAAMLDGMYDVPEAGPISDCFLNVDPETLLPLLDLSSTPLPSLEISEKTSIPPEAADLLRYFKENVVSLSFPLKNCRKCPWQAVHLPAAMTAFAELSVNHTTSHTRLSLFYSLLAASCLHKYARNQSAGGLEISANRVKEAAKQHLELALNEEVLGARRAKYKEILMAVLSMVMLSVYTHQFRQSYVGITNADRYSMAKTLALKPSSSTQSISFASAASPNPTSPSKSGPCTTSTPFSGSWPKAHAAAPC